MVYVIAIFLVFLMQWLPFISCDFAYIYIPADKGRLCFKGGSVGDSMKMSSKCCKNDQIRFENNNLKIGSSKCYGGPINEGGDPKVAALGGCATFQNSTTDSFLKISDTAGSTYCMKEMTNSPKMRACTSTSNYVFLADAKCPAPKASSHVVSLITEMKTPQYTLTNDGSKLTAQLTYNSPTPTILKVYSNSEIYAVIAGQEKCLIVEEKEKLHDLNGLEVLISDSDCQSTTFIFRGDLSTFELTGTDYCWLVEGNSVKLRKCPFTQIFLSVSMTQFSVQTTSVESAHATSTAHVQNSSPTQLPIQSSTLSQPFSSWTPALQETSIHTIGSTRDSTLLHATPSAPFGTQITSLNPTHSFISSSNHLNSITPSHLSHKESIKSTTSELKVKSTKTRLMAEQSSLFIDAASVSKSVPDSWSNVPTSSISYEPAKDKVVHGLELAEPGQQCQEFCRSKGKYCSSRIATGNSNAAFRDNGVTCKEGNEGMFWKKAFDPSFNTSSNLCSGYLSVNETVPCSVAGFSSPDIRRLCKCVASAYEDNYSSWLPWTACSASCNTGEQRRSRTCIKEPCIGGSVQKRYCNRKACPINGGFTVWAAWTACSVTCGGGAKSRTRSCTNPNPMHGGFDCFGDRSQTTICNVQKCPIDGGWSLWTDWSACDKPCNGGSFRKWRYCTNPAPLFGGRPCQGEPKENTPCNTHICPAENVTAAEVRFDKAWKNEMVIVGSQDYEDFYAQLKNNTKIIYEDNSLNSTYLYCSIDNLRQGSVIATFTLFFTGLDSFQMLLLQDAIQDDKYLGKLKIMTSNISFSSSLVPSSSPVNFTLTALSPTEISASWQEVPNNHQNGNTTGYILFYRQKLLRSDPYYSLAAKSLNVTLQGLLPYTEYVFRVLAYNQNGNGVATALLSKFTKESVPSQPPTSIQATADSPNTIIISWVGLQQEHWNGVPVGTVLTYTDPDGHSKSQTAPFPKTSYSIDNLVPLTTYVIDVCAVTKAGKGPCQKDQATTLESPPSKPPSNLTVETMMSFNSLKVSWRHTSTVYVHGELKGYKIVYRLVKTGGEMVASSRTQSKKIHPSQIETTLTNLQPNSQYSVSVLAYNEYGDGTISGKIYADTCPCPDDIYTNYAASAPYIYRDRSGILKGLIADILTNVTTAICSVCRGNSRSSLNFKSNGKNGWAEKNSIKNMKTDIDDYVHISFPVFANSELGVYSGYSFVALFNHPGVVYFIIKDTMAKQIRGMVKNVFDTWPIMLVNFLLITVSGFFIWALDSRQNSDEFPRGLKGVGSGMYWSFVTMGTHGYGDLAPKSILARIYAVFWILTGIVNIGILTGALTTAITVAQVYDSALIYDVEVAAVQDSEAYRIGLHRNAKVNEKSQYHTIEEVASALKRREVRGALVDVYSAALRSDLFDHPDIVAKNNIKYPNAYGLVLSGEMQNAASSFRDYINANADEFLQDIKKRASSLEVKKEAGQTISMFDGKSESLQKTLLILAIVLVICCLCGALFSYHRAKRVEARIEIVEYTRSIETLCEENFYQFQNSITKKINALMEFHLEERVKMFSKSKILPKSRFMSLNRPKKDDSTVTSMGSQQVDAIRPSKDVVENAQTNSNLKAADAEKKRDEMLQNDEVIAFKDT